jgi:hypothetical protein
MAVTNTLAYYRVATITAIICFIVQFQAEIVKFLKSLIDF